MRKAMVKLYKYAELTEEVKVKVRDWYREMQAECGDYTRDVSEFFEYELEALGYPTDKVYWSLSNCQGDGMAFYGDIDRDSIAKIRNRVLGNKNPARSITKTFLFNEVTFTIASNNPHYNHYNSMAVNFEASNSVSDKMYKLLCEIRDGIAEEVKQVSKDLARKGYDIIESMEADEYVDSEIEAQEDWEFHIDGELWRKR